MGNAARPRVDSRSREDEEGRRGRARRVEGTVKGWLKREKSLTPSWWDVGIEFAQTWGRRTFVPQALALHACRSPRQATFPCRPVLLPAGRLALSLALCCVSSVVCLVRNTSCTSGCSLTFLPKPRVTHWLRTYLDGTSRSKHSFTGRCRCGQDRLSLVCTTCPVQTSFIVMRTLP